MGGLTVQEMLDRDLEGGGESRGKDWVTVGGLETTRRTQTVASSSAQESRERMGEEVRNTENSVDTEVLAQPSDRGPSVPIAQVVETGCLAQAKPLFESTWEDSSHCNTTSPYRYTYRSASLDVCIGNFACTWVSQSGVRGTVGVCCPNPCLCQAELSRAHATQLPLSQRHPRTAKQPDTNTRLVSSDRGASTEPTQRHSMRVSVLRSTSNMDPNHVSGSRARERAKTAPEKHWLSSTFLECSPQPLFQLERVRV